MEAKLAEYKGNHITQEQHRQVVQAEKVGLTYLPAAINLLMICMCSRCRWRRSLMWIVND